MTVGDVKRMLLQNRTVGILAVLATILALYGTSADLKLFADDYISWTAVKSTLDQPWWSLLSVFYNPEFYRPFDHLLIRANLEWLGGDPLLYRWATIIGHMLTVLAVYWLVRRFAFGRAAALIAAAFFGWSHANGMAALSNDSASQVYAVFCGTMALGFAWPKYGRSLRFWEILISAAWLGGSLLWKDAGVSYVPAVALLWLIEVRRAPADRRLRDGVVVALPYVVVLALYFALRVNAGAMGPAWCGPGRYDICLGLNVPRNIGLFLLGLFTPVGSSIVMLRLKSHLFVALWAASVAVVGAFWAGGLAERYRAETGERGRLALFLALMFLVMLPDVLMNRVSELYLYKPNTLFAALLGLGVAALIRRWSVSGRRVLLVILTVLLVTLAWSNGKSVMHKVHRLRTGGLWAGILMHEIQAQMPTLPTDQIIATNREAGPAPLYSIYYMEGIFVLGGGKIFEYYYGVPIREYRFCEWEDLDRALAELPGKKIILVYSRDHVRVAVSEGENNPFATP